MRRIKVNSSVKRFSSDYAQTTSLMADTPGSVADILINKPATYRLLYDPKNDIYFIANAYEYGHYHIWMFLRELGYETPAVFDSVEWDPSCSDDYDKMVRLFFYSITDEDARKDIEDSFKFYPNVDRVFLETGMLETYNSTLENQVPELLATLKRRHALISQEEFMEKWGREA